MNMFSSPKPAAVPAQTVMPTENSTAVAQAQQQELQAAATRSGRASTILTQNDISKTDTMGG